jgi:hypothetical protein
MGPYEARDALQSRPRSKRLSSQPASQGSPVDITIERVYSIGVSNREPSKADVLQGTLDIMILQTLTTLGASHGYAIAARLEQVSGGRVQLNMGTLYPGLMRLEQRGFITVL